MKTRKSYIQPLQETDSIMQTWKCERSQNLGKAKKTRTILLR